MDRITKSLNCDRLTTRKQTQTQTHTSLTQISRNWKHKIQSAHSTSSPPAPSMRKSFDGAFDGRRIEQPKQMGRRLRTRHGADRGRTKPGPGTIRSPAGGRNQKEEEGGRVGGHSAAPTWMKKGGARTVATQNETILLLRATVRLTSTPSLLS